MYSGLTMPTPAPFPLCAHDRPLWTPQVPPLVRPLASLPRSCCGLLRAFSWLFASFSLMFECPVPSWSDVLGFGSTTSTSWCRAGTPGAHYAACRIPWISSRFPMSLQTSCPICGAVRSLCGAWYSYSSILPAPTTSAWAFTSNSCWSGRAPQPAFWGRWRTLWAFVVAPFRPTCARSCRRSSATTASRSCTLSRHPAKRSRPRISAQMINGNRTSRCRCEMVAAAMHGVVSPKNYLYCTLSRLSVFPKPHSGTFNRPSPCF